MFDAKRGTHMIQSHACSPPVVDFEWFSFVPVIRRLKARWFHASVDRRSDVLTAGFIIISSTLYASGRQALCTPQ